MAKGDHQALRTTLGLPDGSVPHSPFVRATLVLLGMLLFGYTVLRAITVSFSWDEAWTYTHYVSKAVFYQLNYDKMGGNHHLFNVWLMWLSSKLFGTSELALRLPNLMAHALYLYASGRIALKARSGFLAMAVFVLLNTHPYLLDFFSLARGYGLACGFMMLALWHVWRYFDEDRAARQVLWATVYASLAAISHIIMVNFLLAFGLAFLVTWAMETGIKNGRHRRKHFFILCTGILIGLAIITPNALGLFNGGSLNFGCDSFWHCMVRTLGIKVLYHQPYQTPVLTILAIGIVSIALVCLISLALSFRAKQLLSMWPMFFGILILGGCLLSFFMQHLLFNVPLPASRTGLFLVPLIAFILVAALIAWPGNTWAPSLSAGILCVPLIIHQYNSFNLKYAVEWKPEGEVAHMLDIIAKDHLPLTRSRPIVTVCSSFESDGCIPYYQRTRDMEWLVNTSRRSPDPYVNSDYYIVEYDGYDRVDTMNWELLYHSIATNTSLYRDERWRDPAPVILFRERNDLEDPNLLGRSTDQYVSGNQSILFDRSVLATDSIKWVVPTGLDSTLVMLSGSGMVLQQDDSDWIMLQIIVLRGGKQVACADVSSALQIKRFSEWNKVGILLRPSLTLIPNDVVVLCAMPYTATTPLYLDDLELNVLCSASSGKDKGSRSKH